MKPIIEPVDRSLLKAELNEERLLRTTNRAANELYIVGPEAVNVIREIGRLREISFRNDGGGTGEPLDIDKFDTDPSYGYKQLILWNPETEEIIGGYRFCLCDEAVFDRFGQPILTSTHMFEFSQKYLKEQFSQTLELGRSFISLEYQSSKAGAKGLYALDNLFDGIGALGILYKDRIKYFFGKMTIYPSYPEQARDMVLYFLWKYFRKGAKRVRLREGIQEVKVANPRQFASLFKGNNYKEDYKILKSEILKLGVSIPPLVNTYMNLSPTMVYYGTGINDEFGNVLDSGIMITFDEMYPEKRERHAESFRKLGWRKIRSLLKRFQRKPSDGQ
jgi:hypothetical protein